MATAAPAAHPPATAGTGAPGSPTFATLDDIEADKYDTVGADMSDVVAVLTSRMLLHDCTDKAHLEAESISAQTVGAACATLGDASLAAHIAPNDPVGQPIFSALLASHGPGSIPASDLVRWVQGEKRVKALAAWIGGLFSDAALIERHDRNLRYTMGASGAYVGVCIDGYCVAHLSI